ncbi:hypothetical protein SNEBB_002845 [Seison nebaliae]|nr:hypothetical protein SNEBB_002845 [Seison nebaliae]
MYFKRNYVRLFNQIHRQKVLNLRPLSTKVVTKKDESVPVKKKSIFSLFSSDKDRKELDEKEKLKKSFLTHLVSGTFDERKLTFPEFESKELAENLETYRLAMKDYLENSGKVSSSVIEKLQLNGLTVPESYGGKNISFLQLFAILEELSIDPKLYYSYLSTNVICVNLLKNMEKEKKSEEIGRIFEDINENKINCVMALNEMQCGADISRLLTTAFFDEANEKYVLNGEKTSIISNDPDIILIPLNILRKNALKSNYYDMLTKNKEMDNDIDEESKEIMKSDKSIEEKEKLKKLIFKESLLMKLEDSNEMDFAIVAVDLRKLTVEQKKQIIIEQQENENLINIKLNNLTVEPSQILCRGPIAIESIMATYPIAQAATLPAFTSMVKSLLGDVVKFVTNSTTFTMRNGRRLCEMELVQVRLFELEKKVYSVESLTYWLAGIIDDKIEDIKEVRLDVMSAKSFIQETSKEIVNDAINLFGELAINDEKVNGKRKFILELNSFFGSTTALNELSGLLIMSSAYNVQYDTMNSMEDGNKRAYMISKRLWSNYIKRKRKHLDPKRFTFFSMSGTNEYQYQPSESDINVHHFVHPSLQTVSLDYENTLNEFDRHLDHIIFQEKGEMVDRGYELDVYARILSKLQAATACLARSSRSYSIGLRAANREMQLVQSFVSFECKRMMKELEFLKENSKTSSSVHQLYELANQYEMKMREYPYSHPLTKNF